MLNKLVNYSSNHVINYGSRYKLFSIFSLINLVKIFAMGFPSAVFTCSVSLGILLTIGLRLEKYWSQTYHRFFPFYWHITVAYCLPFLSTFLLLICLRSGDVILFSYGVVQLAFSTLLLAHLVNLCPFRRLSAIGIFSGLSLERFIFYNEESMLYFLWKSKPHIYLLFSTYISAVTIGLFFFQKKKKQRNYMHRVFRTFGRELLHITSNIVGIGKSYASFIELCLASANVKQEGQRVKIEMDTLTYRALHENLKLLKKAHDHGQILMKQRISSLTINIRKEDFSRYSAAASVHEALSMYSQLNGEDQELPSVTLHNDFFFEGSDKYLKQIIVNLLGFSDAYRTRKNRGKIWLENRTIKLAYISSDASFMDLRTLFNYPENPIFHHLGNQIGSGIGVLYYVREVMKAFGGDVFINISKEVNGDRVCFTLSFPCT